MKPRTPGRKGHSMSVWFITGASRGFGLEITRQALGRGDQVAATARHPGAITERSRTPGTPCWPCRSTSPTLARRPRRSRHLPRGSAGSTRWSTTRGAVCSAQSKRSPTPRRERYSTSTSSACSASPAPSCRSCASRVRGRSSTCRRPAGSSGALAGGSTLRRSSRSRASLKVCDTNSGRSESRSRRSSPGGSGRTSSTTAASSPPGQRSGTTPPPRARPANGRRGPTTRSLAIPLRPQR